MFSKLAKNRASKQLFSASSACFSTLKKTKLHSWHTEKQGAKMTEFAGYDMPVQYPLGVLKEHNAVRGAAGLFDVSHMGQVRIFGKDRAEFMERILVSRVTKMKNNAISYSLIPNHQGGLVDDCVVSVFEDHIFLVVNAGCKEKDLAHMRQELEENWKDKDVAIEYYPEQALLALQGPKAESILQELVDYDLKGMYFMNAAPMEMKKLGESVLVSRCGYTGEDGFELSVSSENVEALAELLLANGVASLAGLGARDSLRLEAGLSLYGHDLDDTTSPIEAGLNWVIPKKRREEGGFIGDKVILDHLANGVSRIRVGFTMSGPSAREGAKIYSEDGSEEVGVVTSGTISPILKKAVGMGYLKFGNHAPGTELKVDVRGKLRPLTVGKPPFVPTNYKIRPKKKKVAKKTTA